MLYDFEKTMKKATSGDKEAQNTLSRNITDDLLAAEGIALISTVGSGEALITGIVAAEDFSSFFIF